MGKTLGADGIVFGRFFYDKKKDKMVVEGKILSVIDGGILAQKKVSAPLNNKIFDATDELALYLSRSIKDLFMPTDLGALWRTAALPGWGYFYKQRETWGYVYSGTVGAAFLFAAGATVNFLIKRNNYLTYTPEHVVTPSGETALVDAEGSQATFDDLASKADRARRLALNSVYIFVGLYAVNLIHAYFIPADVGNVRLAYLERDPRPKDVLWVISPRLPLGPVYGLGEAERRALPNTPEFCGWSLSFSLRY